MPPSSLGTSSRAVCCPMESNISGAHLNPATNGKAERFVQTFKQSLKADPGTIPQKLAQFLPAYCSTPHMTTGVTPAELFLKCKIQTRLHLMRPSLKDYIQEKQRT